MGKSFRELVDGVFVREDEQHTTGLIRTRAGALLVDPGDDEQEVAALHRLLEELDLEVRMVVSTSGGARRAAGARHFPEALLLYPSPGDPPRAEGPAVSFTRDAYLRLGITSVELLHVGSPAHDMLLVNLPTRAAAFLGASVPGVVGARLEDGERQALLERVRGLDARVVVPGRGAPLPGGDLRLLERRLSEAGAPSLALVEKGAARRAAGNEA